MSAFGSRADMVPEPPGVRLLNVDGLVVDIDARYNIFDLSDALSRQTERGRVGRVVVDVAERW